MRIPNSWNDRRLLQDEPFLTAFEGLVPGKTFTNLGKKISVIVKSLQEIAGINEVMEAWIKHAFIRLPKDRPRASCPAPKDVDTMRLFVEFYSCLARDNEVAALVILNRGRSGRGLSSIDWHTNYQEALALSSASAPTIRKKNKSTTSAKNLNTRFRHTDQAKVNSSLASAKPTHKDVPSKPPTGASGILAPRCSTVGGEASTTSKQQLNKNKLKRSLNASDVRPFKKRAIVDCSDGLQDSAETDKTTDAELLQTRPKPRSEFVGETVNLRRSTRNAKPLLSSIHHGQRSEQLQNRKLLDEASAPIGMPNDRQTLQTKQEVVAVALPGSLEIHGASAKVPARILETQKKRPASPSDLREGKRRAVGDGNPQRILGNSSNLLEVNPAKGALVETRNKTAELSASNGGNVLTTKKRTGNRKRLSSNPTSKIDTANHTKSDTKMELPEILIPLGPEDIIPSTVTLEQDVRQPSPLRIEAESDTLIPALQLHPDPLLQIPYKALLQEFFPIEAESDALIPALQLHPDPLPQITYKAPLEEFPPIWAQSRQEVCESFDWFRSYQGGVYHTREMAKGYLLSGFPSSRDRFEHGGRLIISHGGGKAESVHSTKGQISSHPASDQLAQDKSIRALLNNYKNGRPLALLIDDKFALFPYDLGLKDITYAVLGFYIVEHVWAEYQHANNETGHVVRYKFAFRWCEDQGPPWWIPKLTSEKPPSQPLTTPVVPSESETKIALDAIRALEGHLDQSQLSIEKNAISQPKVCTHCCRPSPRVFRLHWACLIPDCRMFWRQVEGTCAGHYLTGDLSYHPRFLELPPPKPLPFGFQDVVRSLLKGNIVAGSLRNYHFTRGFHCRKCGRLSSRYQWEKWECLSCRETLEIPMPIHFAKDIWNQTLPISFRDFLVNPISDIIPAASATFTHETGRGIINSFILPHSRGKIHHIQPGNASGRKEADRIFLDYQTQAASGILKFRRWPLRAHKCRGPLLTNYFSHNAGEPYKYVGGDANTVTFESAPVVCDARDLIEKRVKQALNIPIKFNEVLSAAYMERQKMAFHSDNEVGLGPVVAGLSLGSPALMHFRLHPRFDPEREKRGILLSIVLRHGDVLVMDGAGVQEFYEHTAVPNNFRIAATARQIGATHS